MGDIERGFGRVADRIVDRDRSAKAVIGCSWLMDTPIAKRLGFIQVPEAEMPVNDFSTWLQFVNEDGQIHQERLHHMLETGALPFRSRLAYMPTEKFLEKYLSEERKQEGPIELDEVDDQASIEFGELRKAVARANEDWDEEVSQNGSIDLDDYIQRHPAISELLNNYYPDEDRAVMEKFMREMAEKGVKRGEFPKYLTKRVEQASATSNQQICKKLYRPKTLDFRKSGASEEVA